MLEMVLFRACREVRIAWRTCPMNRVGMVEPAILPEKQAGAQYLLNTGSGRMAGRGDVWNN